MEQIKIIRAQTLALLVELTEHPKPSYSLDGQSVDWETYQKQLQNTLDWCDAKLAGEEPFEFHTQAGT
ncbi:MAG: hypothetical protein Q4D98_02425 [Planctomycetia bacterium]|nr:hypothetical protein [Planctomycetia bacterium]